MQTQLRPALSLFVVLSVVTGVIYPLAVTGVAQVLFPHEANGSIVTVDGKPVGSALIGQQFTEPKYFWGRLSATGPYPYNAAASSGSNLGPLNPALTDAVKARIDALKAADPGNAQPVPVDLVTASASGLDPDISLAAAYYQAERVAKVRNLPHRTDSGAHRTERRPARAGFLRRTARECAQAQSRARRRTGTTARRSTLNTWHLTTNAPTPTNCSHASRSRNKQARRGKLKIFFGASPGVGKTYAMLNEARRLRAQGLDVVVGVVETHGRSETAALLEGLDVLPRKAVEHRGGTLQEFDLDAALKRRPAVLLIDELAHTNAPGCRHPKRWQDVEELLAAGIDVLSTVNVQHIESLNDIVGGITGVRVWETVPDRIFAAADEIMLVDLTPDDLLVRLREGKVYLPDQAERAIQNFFRKGNLIALRELALRQTADRVDDQMLALRRASAPERVWQTGDTLLVCIGPNDADEKVVRTAARLAAKLDSAWHAVYVETPALQRLPEVRRRSILKTLKLAQDLGAVTATLAEQDTVEAVLAYARRHNLGRIVVGRSTHTHSRWFPRETFNRRLGSQAPDIDLLTVARDEAQLRRATPDTPESVRGEPLRLENIRAYGYALLTCIGIAVGATPLLEYLDLANIVMLFLAGVMFVAFRFGRGPAVFAAILNVVVFDFFFVPPRFTFAVSDVQYLLTFVVMLVVGLVTGQLTAGLRYQARVARSREERARSLSEMAKSLSSALVEQQVVEISDKFLEASFRAKAAILLPDLNDTLHPPAVGHAWRHAGLRSGHRAMVLRQERTRRQRHRHAASESATVSAAQGADARARCAGGGTGQSAPADDSRTEPSAGNLRRADRHRTGTHPLRIHRPGNADSYGVRALAQLPARDVVARSAHTAHRVGRFGRNAVAGVGGGGILACGQGRRDP